MPYIPHTDQEAQEMLKVIGVDSIDNLFDEIPDAIRINGLEHVPTGISEMQATRLSKELSAKDSFRLNFIGAGAYEHHIPAAVWEITGRGEFLTCYTPYQAEASQGTLQLLYEFQSMIASLTGMDVSNTSMYDGATALAEAVLMSVRCHRKSKSKTILMPRTVHPSYRKVVKTLVQGQKIKLIDVDFDKATGKIDMAVLKQYEGDDITALVIPQPNFFGALDDVDALTRWAHENNAMAIAVVNPLSLAMLKEPGQWGDNGADIVCGELQPMGMPLYSGGPYAGMLCCKQEFVRQTREQHIKRDKATSNICTNQGLLVTAATIHMSLLGPEGIKRVAQHCHANTKLLVEKLQKVKGVKKIFTAPYFHEVVVQFDKPVAEVLSALSKQDILAGFDLSKDYPELENSLLICATETKIEEDLNTLVDALAQENK